MIQKTWKDKLPGSKVRVSVIPSFDLLFKLREELINAGNVLTLTYKGKTQQFNISFDEIGLGYSGVMSPDGRVAFELTASIEDILKKSQSIQGKELIKESELMKALADKLKQIAKQNGIGNNIESIIYVQQRSAAHYSMQNGAFEVDKSTKLWGFSINPKPGNSNKLEIGFSSGSVNANRGIGLSGKVKTSRFGPSGWDYTDTVLNRTDQKKIFKYLQEADYIQGNTYSLELKANYW